MKNRIEEIVNGMRSSSKSVRFQELKIVCDHYFDRPRRTGGSHCVYKTPWFGDPRVIYKMIMEKQKHIK